MNHWLLAYIFGAVCTLAWLLFGIFGSWKAGYIRISGDDTGLLYWQLLRQLAHGALGGAAIWPITLMMQVMAWRTHQALGGGEPPTLTVKSWAAYYPPEEQFHQQSHAIMEACNEAFSRLPQWTNEFVIADMMLSIAAQQAFAKCKQVGESERACRELLIHRVAAAFDVVAKSTGMAEPPPCPKHGSGSAVNKAIDDSYHVWMCTRCDRWLARAPISQSAETP